MRIVKIASLAALIAAFAPSVVCAGPVILRPVKLPDLVVSDLHMTSIPQGTSGPSIGSIFITVKEMCGVALTKQYHMTINVYSDKASAKLLYTKTYGSSKPGNVIENWELPVGSQQLPFLSYVTVDADSNNEIAEDLETNNYKWLNPNYAPFPPNAATYCKPKSSLPIQTQ